MNSKDAKVKNVSTAGGKLTVWVDDGRVLSLPLEWYPSLKSASPAQRTRWRKSGAGHGIHWPALDEDLGVAGGLVGWRPGGEDHSGPYEKVSRPIHSPFRSSSGSTPQAQADLGLIGRGPFSQTTEVLATKRHKNSQKAEGIGVFFRGFSCLFVAIKILCPLMDCCRVEPRHQPLLGTDQDGPTLGNLHRAIGNRRS